MLKFVAKVKSQIYRSVGAINVGDKIYLNYQKENGILTVKNIAAHISHNGNEYLIITTDRYYITIRTECSIPFIEPNIYIIRRIPKYGQYYLMGGLRLDCNGFRESYYGSGCSIRLIENPKEVEYFEDPLKSYSDSKTKEIETTKKTSKYSAMNIFRVPDKNYKWVLKEKLVEFEYNKDNFLIPYKKLYRSVGTFVVPDDVRAIGNRCFSGLLGKRGITRVILPNHEVTFKKGALLNCTTVLPTNCSLPYINIKTDSFIVNGGELNLDSNYHHLYTIKGTATIVGSDYRLSDIIINSNNLKIGDNIPIQIYTTKTFNTKMGTVNMDIHKNVLDGAIVLDVKNNNVVTNIGEFVIDQFNYKINLG